MNFLFVLIAGALFSTPFLFTDDPSGLYVVKFPSGSIMPNDGTHECSENWPGMSGFCIHDYEASNVLGLHLLEDGRLEFATSLSFFNGHTCALQGVADKMESGWLYTESHADAEPAQQSYMNCRLSISITDDTIILNADEDAACRTYCGARGGFYNVKFPVSAKTQNTLSDEVFRCIGRYSVDCESFHDAQ